MNNDKDITIEDVETCIKVIEKFLRVERRAKAILSQLTAHQRYMTPEQQFIQQMLMRRYQQPQPEEEEEELELTDEEREKLEKIKKKLVSDQ